MNRIILSAALAAGIGSVSYVNTASAAVTVGYYTDGNVYDTGPVAPITANGYTPVQINDITTFDFSTVNIVMIDNPSNYGFTGALLAREGDLAAYAAAGGAVVIHDRYVMDNSIIPGGSGISLTRFESSDLNVVTSSNAVINGPFGTITDSTLDGGNYSAHGYGTASNLPTGATVFLSNGADATQAVAFSFPLGAGLVYYSSIPLDFYLDGAGMAAFRTPYAPNVLNYAATAVPEPGVSSLLTASALALLGRRRRRLTMQ